MGKPRMIILIRHAQSEGNKNRAIHQMIPDHRVKLTDEGWKQAEDAGRRLRRLLRPDDTLQIYTSPYRRTRETTEGILKTLTARTDPGDPSAAPSPFSRSKIKVYEEPRLREQDFGNFQPCSAEMERMWKERADYGHFFYRIPNGESAADAYDRIAGFNESLWRQFGDREFPSVCVLVTHGLMTRVFLMKWYHWSVEYFEDLRNVNHCEFIVMKKNLENGKFILENELRTWSELKQQRQAEQTKQNPKQRNTLSTFLKNSHQSPSLPPRQWGGCVEGCDHSHDLYPRRTKQRKEQVEQELLLPPAAQPSTMPQEQQSSFTSEPVVLSSSPDQDRPQITSAPAPQPSPSHLHLPLPRPHLAHDDGGGSTASSVTTPHEMDEGEASEYFSSPRGRNLAQAMRAAPQRKVTPDDIARWASESGMGSGRRADALGDEPEADDDDEDEHGVRGADHGDDGGSDDGLLRDIEAAEKEDKGLRGSVY